MIIALKRGLWLPVLLLTLQVSLGQPSGQITFYFNRDSAPVYDLSGGYAVNHVIASGSLQQPVSFGFGFENDATGRLRGTGTTILQIGEDHAAAFYSVVGSVHGGGANIHADISVRLSGQDLIAGAYRRFSVSMSYHTVIDPENLALVGTGRGSIYVAGIGSSRINEDVSLALPAGVDGSWSLTLNVLTLGRIGGSALFAISNFTPVDYPVGLPTDRLLTGKVSGSFNSHTGDAKVSIQGLYEGRGTSLSLVFDSDGNEVTKMSGRVLGQTVKIP